MRCGYSPPSVSGPAVASCATAASGPDPAVPRAVSAPAVLRAGTWPRQNGRPHGGRHFDWLAARRARSESSCRLLQCRLNTTKLLI